MILFVIASLLLCQVRGNPTIGGEFSEVHVYPWLASIQRDGYHKCGGSIISSTIILTAAHCASYPPRSYVVRVGSSRTDSYGSWHYVTAIKQHEHYDMSLPGISDVALMKVSPPIELGRYGVQIQLTNKDSAVTAGTNVSVAGWGSTLEGGEMEYELRSVQLHIVDSFTCSKAYGDRVGMRMTVNHQICASRLNSGICYGDSGGPLVIEGDIQVGIAFGSIGCANNKYPGVYQDVAYYRDWIDRNSINF